MQHEKIERHVFEFTAADLEEFIRSRVHQVVGNGRDRVDRAVIGWRVFLGETDPLEFASTDLDRVIARVEVSG